MNKKDREFYDNRIATLGTFVIILSMALILTTAGLFIQYNNLSKLEDNLQITPDITSIMLQDGDRVIIILNLQDEVERAVAIGFTDQYNGVYDLYQEFLISEKGGK